MINRSPESTKRNSVQRLVPRAEIIFGYATLAVWLILVFADLRLNLLLNLQKYPPWKFISGLILFVGLSLQAALSIKRIFPDTDPRRSLRKLLLHKRIGNFLPLALILHASGFGYGLNFLLTSVLVINLAQGWWGTKLKGLWYLRAVGAHVVMGILLYALSIYHAVIAIMFHSQV